MRLEVEASRESARIGNAFHRVWSGVTEGGVPCFLLVARPPQGGRIEMMPGAKATIESTREVGRFLGMKAETRLWRVVKMSGVGVDEKDKAVDGGNAGVMLVAAVALEEGHASAEFERELVERPGCRCSMGCRREGGWPRALALSGDRPS